MAQQNSKLNMNWFLRHFSFIYINLFEEGSPSYEIAQQTDYIGQLCYQAVYKDPLNKSFHSGLVSPLY